MNETHCINLPLFHQSNRIPYLVSRISQLVAQPNDKYHAFNSLNMTTVIRSPLNFCLILYENKSR